MHDQFRQGGGKNRNGKAKFKIPTHDPQTGEANPYNEELTGDNLPEHDTAKSSTIPESDSDKFNRLLINTANSDVDFKHKVLIVKKFIETLGEKED